MLKGNSVYLRSVEKRDISILCEYIDDDEVRKYDGGYTIIPSMETLMATFEKLTHGSTQYLSIINEKGVLVGYITYKEHKDTINVYTIGITIGSKFWARGYGTDSIKIILDYLFMYKGAERIELEVVDYNKRAIKCYKRCGFVQEGIKRKKYFSKGTYHDEIIMGILKSEYYKLLEIS